MSILYYLWIIEYVVYVHWVTIYEIKLFPLLNIGITNLSVWWDTSMKLSTGDVILNKHNETAADFGIALLLFMIL